MKSYIFFLCFCLLGCNAKKSINDSVSSNKIEHTKIPMLNMQDKILLNMFDSIINIQKKCSNFCDSTFFVITYFKQDNTFCFEPYNNYKDVFNYNQCIGFLYFKKHYFFSLFKYPEWFQETKEYSTFSYQLENMPPPPGEKGRTIAVIKKGKIFYKTSFFCQ
jgi:hypothetical protein